MAYTYASLGQFGILIKDLGLAHILIQWLRVLARIILLKQYVTVHCLHILYFVMHLVTHKTSGTPLIHHIVAQDTTVGAQVGADRA